MKKTVCVVLFLNLFFAGCYDDNSAEAEYETKAFAVTNIRQETDDCAVACLLMYLHTRYKRAHIKEEFDDTTELSHHDIIPSQSYVMADIEKIALGDYTLFEWIKYELVKLLEMKGISNNLPVEYRFMVSNLIEEDYWKKLMIQSVLDLEPAILAIRSGDEGHAIVLMGFKCKSGLLSGDYTWDGMIEFWYNDPNDKIGNRTMTADELFDVCKVYDGDGNQCFKAITKEGNYCLHIYERSDR